MRQILPGTYSISILPIFLSNRIPIGQDAYLKTFTSPGFFEAQVPRDLVWTNETQVEFYRVGFWKSHCFPDNGSQMALGLWPFIFHHPHPILPPGNLDSTPRGGATILWPGGWKKNHTGDSLARVWKNLESSRTSLNSCESLGLPSSGLIVGYKNQSPVWLIYWIGFCYMQLNAILKTTSWHRLSEFWWSNWMASSVPTQPRALGLHWTKNDAWGMHNCDGILFFLGFKILKDPQYLNMARIPGLSPPEHPPFLEEANFGEHPQLVDVNLGEICQTVVCV